MKTIQEIYPNVQYLILGLEEAPTTKKLHQQGFIQCKHPVNFGTIKTYLNDETIHIEECKGTTE